MIGGEIVEGCGVKWRRLHGALVPYSFPHALGHVPPCGARKLLRRQRARLIRWETSFDVVDPTEWWHVIKDSPQGMADLKPKVRYAVRQGLNSFSIARCPRSRISADGHAVYLAAFERYRTFEARFTAEQFAEAVCAMPGETEFWAVEDKATGELRAFAENVVLDGACFYSSMWFTESSLKQGGSYALIHAMNEHYLVERGLRYVSDGARSISHQTNIHEFLQSKFGFRKAYCTLAVEYAAWVALAVNCLYPVRGLLRRWKISRRLDVLLEQEHLHRACRVAG